MELFLPWILSYMIDDVIPTGRMEYIFMWGGAMIVCSLICIWGNISANRRASAVARETTRSIRHALFEKISYLSSAQIDKITVPSLVSRLTTDTYNMHHMVGMAQRMGVRAPILLLGGLMMTLTLASCFGPAADPAKAEAALEENGYAVTMNDGKLVEVIAMALGIDDLDAQITAVSKEDIDDFITIYYFETKEAADKAWDKVQKEAEDKKDDDSEIVIKKSGKVIYYGTKNAVKAAR
jgi:ABC-type multidrug transport system fused ATPase/permease subunit